MEPTARPRSTHRPHCKPKWKSKPLPFAAVFLALGRCCLVGWWVLPFWCCAQVAVSEGGTPSYSLALAVPPGIAGMSPNIAIAYTGGSVNGPLGYGWSLQGISLITRCPQTRAIDGYARSVAFVPDDKLCLDGQRLIQTGADASVVDPNKVAANNAVGTSATPFQSGDSAGGSGLVREYRTEKDSYARIRAYGSAGTAASNGPAYFKVWTKSGQVYEYGNNANQSANSAINVQGQSVIAAWAVSRISDTLGNYIDFQYTQRDVAWGTGSTANSPTPGHEWNLAEIRYSGNTAANQLPGNKVVFSYSDRPATPVADRAEAYQQGAKNVSIQRLDAIRTYVNIQSTPVEVKAFKIAYGNGAVSGRSLVASISECAGTNESRCQPAPTFQYGSGGNQGFTRSTGFNLSTTKLMDAAGNNYGVVLGDFNGDGKTDILRWGNTPADNQLWLSNGDGTFNAASAFNLTSQQLFSADGCYTSTVADFNGDGVADILRRRQKYPDSGCATVSNGNLLFLGKGDGTFGAALPMTVSGSSTEIDFSTGDPTIHRKTGTDYSVSQGNAFHIADVNGDGILDIITTLMPGYSTETGVAAPTADSRCASITCTHVYLGTQAGTFTELTSTNLAHHSVYAPISAKGAYSALLVPTTVDVNGDGLTDLVVSTGIWFSSGDGNFTLKTSPGTAACANPLDFNGDGRLDCVNLSTAGTASAQTLQVMTGQTLSGVASFSLVQTGNELFAIASNSQQSIGLLIGDFNGDGRSDILRWENDPSKNVIYLSNGDGTFSPSTTFNLTGAAQVLRHSDGKTTYLAADFSGRGALEILRMKDSPASTSEATANQLYVRTDPTPPDQLTAVVSATGLKTTLTWVPLSNPTPSNAATAIAALGPRYTSDRGSAAAATYPQVDLDAPVYVVATSVADTGVGTAQLTTEYAYVGLKAAYDGRGALGFRQTRRQSPAPDGSSLLVTTDYLQTHPYIGVAYATKTSLGTLNTPPTQLSSTQSIYCEQAAATSSALAAATTTAPCVVTAKVQRPFLYKTIETGSDLLGNALPTVTTTNTFDAYGNPTTITVATALGNAAGTTKTTSNAYTNDTSNDNWVLGRLTAATQHNVVPNTIANLTPQAGPATNATAIQGTGTMPPAPGTVSASLSAPSLSSTMVGASTTGTATLTNTGSASIAVTVPTAASVSGTDFGFVSTTCGTSLAVGASCTVTVGFTPTAAVTRTGTVTVGTQVGAQSASLSGVGLTVPALGLASCQSVTPTTAPTPATYSCTLTNGGQSTATTVTYASTLNGASVSGPSSCAAGSCGTVTLTTPTAAGAYSGNLTATPNAGSAAATTFSLQVNAAPSASFSAPSFSSTMVGASTTGTATLTNTGSVSMAVTVPTAASVSGTDFAFVSTTCGTSLAVGASCAVTVGFTPTAGATRTGSVTIGTQAGTQTASLSGVGLTAPALSLGACTSVTATTTPTAATYSCTLSNSGQTNATAVAYTATASGVTVSGPSSCAVGSCGTVVLTTSTASGTYAGTLTATPNAGSAAAATFSLQVNAAASLVFTVSSSTGFSTTFKNPNATAVTATDSGIATTGIPSAYITTNTCNSAVAAGGTCVINFTAPASDCKADNYSVYAYVRTAAGTATGTTVNRTSTRAICP